MLGEPAGHPNMSHPRWPSRYLEPLPHDVEKIHERYTTAKSESFREVYLLPFIQEAFGDDLWTLAEWKKTTSEYDIPMPDEPAISRARHEMAWHIVKGQHTSGLSPAEFLERAYPEKGPYTTHTINKVLQLARRHENGIRWAAKAK